MVVSCNAKYRSVHIQSGKKKGKKKEKNSPHSVRMEKAVIQVDKML